MIQIDHLSTSPDSGLGFALQFDGISSTSRRAIMATPLLVAARVTIEITFCYEINFWCPALRAAQKLAAMQHFAGKTDACQFSSGPRLALADEAKHNR
ncbi:hypothetical protein PWG15_24910 (plasmid) [Ensifer adhaerens]|uniref:hypothetical protein n=1 Tax=Ensifer adhaerens TaxID=106592 RepID=UPI0023A9DAAD|nr:hypothetical protein [Ensifer adhaerens]WDZ80994.1 hypothetical protein PWG15_24910 [Ensifer adhaerens]